MKSYLKFLSRNKLYTAIEAAGLVISLAFVILIGQYIWQQYSIAYENPIRDRVYAVGYDENLGLSWWDKYDFEQKIPEVEAACRIGGMDEVAVKIDESVILSDAAYIDASFFELFPQYGLSAGDIRDFAMKGRCFVSQSFADANFGGDAIGRQIATMEELMSDEQEYTICGIYPDFDNTMMPAHSILLNAEYDESHNRSEPYKSIGNYLTLIKVRKGTERETIAGKIYEVCRPNYDEKWIDSFPIYNIPEVYFNSGQSTFRRGDKQMLGILTVVVLLLLVSAIFNYENLNLALSGYRAKEMATRRMLGASKESVICRFIGESVLFTMVCFGLALLLAYAMLPIVDRLIYSASIRDSFEKMQYLNMRIDWSAYTVAAYIVMILLLGATAGIAPALFASRFQPVDIVRGAFRRQTKMWFSKIFIVFQSAVAVALIAVSIIMEVQMHHMMTRPLNARSKGVYHIRFFSRTYDEAIPLIDRLERIPNVGRIGYGSGYAGQINMTMFLRTPDGKPARFSIIMADDTFFDIMDLHILESRNAPAANTFWMSESLAREVSLTDSLEMFFGSQVILNGVKSENFGGIYADIPTQEASTDNIMNNSVILVSRRNEIIYGNGLIIEVSDAFNETAEAIRKAYAEYSEERNGVYIAPYRMGYIDDLMRESLAPIRASMRIVELFMALAVLISLLGLVAMSTYFSGEKTTAIAIRKVFGSDVSRELWSSVSDYMRLVLFSTLIGIPVAVCAATGYLEQFDYRIEGYGWIFIVSVLISAATAFLSVLWQTLRVARTNPATELKKD